MGIFVTACYTVLIVVSDIGAKAHSNLFPPGFDVGSLTAQEVQDREHGSKMVVVIEQMQIAVIWACKACLLFLYYRLTRMVASKENVAIKLLAVYVLFGFVIMELLYFTAWCRPFPQYWAVPTTSSQCNALTNHRITNAIFNISSDLLMLCIALPLFIRSFLPLKRKLILCCIFSLGFFVVLAAVLNKYYNFRTPYQQTWIRWYVRESSTAILVANLPFTWTLLRKIFNLAAFDEVGVPPPTYHSSRTAGGRKTVRTQTYHGGPGSGSAEKHVQVPCSSGGRRTSRSLSLIGSICLTKEERKEHISNISDNSEHSSNGLLHPTIQTHDFALTSTDPTNTPHLTIERASPSLQQPTPNLTPRSSISRPTSPAPRFSMDGTGGFHLTRPRRAHLSHPHSRSSSYASVSRRPLSAEPSSRSDGTGSTNGTVVATLGGGRSARDRRTRARMSA
jgi:hypothetical protein